MFLLNLRPCDQIYCGQTAGVTGDSVPVTGGGGFVCSVFGGDKNKATSSIICPLMHMAKIRETAFTNVSVWLHLQLHHSTSSAGVYIYYTSSSWLSIFLAVNLLGAPFFKSKRFLVLSQALN